MPDLKERELWNDYMAAYYAALTHTSTESAPWYVVPADHKWYAHIAASSVIVNALADIDPQYPTATRDPRELEAARIELEAQAPLP